TLGYRHCRLVHWTPSRGGRRNRSRTRRLRGVVSLQQPPLLPRHRRILGLCEAGSSRPRCRPRRPCRVDRNSGGTRDAQAYQPGISGERREPRASERPRFRGNRESPAARAIGRPLARLRDRRAIARQGRKRVKRSIVIAALGTAQTLAWGSSYYLPAILADPIAQGLGLSRTTVFGLFSGALLLSAVLGPSVGRAIDNRGGRGVLALSNLVLAVGLALLGIAEGFFTLALAWAVLGVGMAMGLYDPAFATLTGLYGRAARGPITGITLIAGFASTVGWPISAFLDAQFGWRAACLIWAALHIVIGLPLN